MSEKTVLYSAAHSGFDLSRVPLGGAAAVCSHLVEIWGKTHPFEFRVLGPEILGTRSPRNKDLVRFSEIQYARFCFEFESALTAEILQHPPEKTVVLSNDISEGPDFRLLADRGYSLWTLYHVDVVDYLAAIYLRHYLKPETTIKVYDFFAKSPFRMCLPRVLGLVFKKQRESLVYSRGVIVPSEAMKRILMRCYPDVSPAKIHVMPWGIWEEDFQESVLTEKTEELRQFYGIPEGAPVLMTLSRLSPEKGQDRLLKALKLWEGADDFPAQGLWVFLCGEAAYMKGTRFQRELAKRAGQLRKTRVVFPGHVSGLTKQAFFRLADLYVFPSRHESYGLTLLEAMRAGLPALATHHYGAIDLLRPEFGELLPPAWENETPKLLEEALRRLLSDRPRLQTMGKQAKAFAEQQKFTETAARLAQLVIS